jgi:hypothetical protein
MKTEIARQFSLKSFNIKFLRNIFILSPIFPAYGRKERFNRLLTAIKTPKIRLIKIYILYESRFKREYVYFFVIKKSKIFWNLNETQAYNLAERPLINFNCIKVYS